MATSNVYTLLDPETATFFGPPISFAIGSGVTSLYEVSVFLLFFFLAVIGVAGVGKILYALVLMVGPFGEASEAKYTKAKKTISDVLFALLFSFGLVLFVLAINPDIARGNVDLAKLWVGSSVNQSAQTQARVGSGGVSRAPSRSPLEEAILERSIRERLSSGGVDINKESCSVSPGNCTNVAGLHAETISMLLNLKRLCNCSVVITGGTEPGHQTHRGREVDLRITNTSDALYTFIKNNSSTLGELRRSNGSLLCHQRYKWVGSTSYTFCDEVGGDRHWHVS